MIPNFFIVGAPKCGTTSMYKYLSQHPEINFSSIKEPNYFSKDFPRLRRVTNQDDYLSLFKNCDKKNIIAEASVNYLASECAIDELIRLSPDAKILVMLRNPIEMAYSLHSQLLFTGDENIDCFIDAWLKQEMRYKGKAIPKKCREEKYLQYTEMCSLGKQVKSLLKKIDRKKVCFVLQEDLKNNAEHEVSRVIKFLGIKEYKKIDYTVVNENKVSKIKLLAGINHRKIPTSISMAIKILKTLIGLRNIGIRKKIMSYNRINKKRETLDKNKVNNLVLPCFESDIKLLSKLIERDLSKWYENE